MIRFEAQFDGLLQATAHIAAVLDERVQQGFELTLESIAATAKQTTTFVDRTGALRNSIQSDGVSGTDPMVGIVSFAAVSGVGLRLKRGNQRRSQGGGFPYGLSQEFGSSNGVKAKHFIRDAINAEDGALIESAMRAAFRDSGFEVT